MRLTTANASLPRAFAPIALRGSDDELSLLLLQCGRGDDLAFRRLHQLVVPRLMRFALQLRTRHDFAEDVLQESMIAIWRQSASYNPGLASPMTWMITIVRHKAFDAFRASKIRFGASDEPGADDESADESAPSPCMSLELLQSTADIKRCLARLVAMQRVAIELAYLHEMTHHEVALVLGKPLGTVKTWIRRGVIELRREMPRQESL